MMLEMMVAYVESGRPHYSLLKPANPTGKDDEEDPSLWCHVDTAESDSDVSRQRPLPSHFQCNINFLSRLRWTFAWLVDLGFGLLRLGSCRDFRTLGTLQTS